MAENESLKVCLERRNFIGIVQKFHRNQFIFIGKTQEQEKIPVFQTEPKCRG
jgi:hypothetical protein